MNDPSLYLKSETLIVHGTESIIKKYFSLLIHNNNGKCTILDIGCGPGNITHNVLFPKFKNPISKVVGIDVSKKMVDFANAAYGNHIFSFDLFDISKEVPEKYVSCFDYVFSFLCLQWIRDQRLLFFNIHKVMKTNGQMLLFFIAQSKLYDIYQRVWHKPEYLQYIDDFNAGQSLFQNSEHPKTDLQNILEQAGFEVCLNRIEIIHSKKTIAETFREYLISINPYYHKIPDHLKNKFIEDHLEEFCDDGNDVNNYHISTKNFVVYAKKK